jgi:hypothetical protein
MKVHLNQAIELDDRNFTVWIDERWEPGIEVAINPIAGQEGVGLLTVHQNGATRIRIEGIPLTSIRIHPRLLMGRK